VAAALYGLLAAASAKQAALMPAKTAHIKRADPQRGKAIVGAAMKRMIWNG
jgi:hypothetical protein